MYIKSSLLTVALLAMVIVGITEMGIAGEMDVVKVVAGFNQSITERDMDMVMEQLAEGSVQIQLPPTYPGETDNSPLSVDLRQNWQNTGVAWNSAASKYLRQSKILSVEQHGDFATIWVSTSTATPGKNTTEVRHSRFSEVYLLVKNGGVWQIAANAKNRGVEQDG